jgi:hypothetical protein
MPIDVGEVPITYKHFQREQVPSLPRNPTIPGGATKVEYSPAEKKEIYWSEVQKAVQIAMKRLNRLHTDSPHEVDLVGDLMFGPFRLDQETLRSTRDPFSKEASAKIQHNLAHNVLYASNGDASQQYRDGMYDILAIQQNIAGSDYGKALLLNKFWSGVRSEVGIIKSLRETGYTVWIPDYAEDPESDENNDEVMEWDVKKGIDFVAQIGKKVFLADGKGRMMLKDHNVQNNEVRPEPGEYYKHQKSDALGELPPTLQNLIRSINPETVQKVTIVVPSLGVSVLQPRDQAHDARDRLRSYSTLPDHHHNALFNKLKAMP